MPTLFEPAATGVVRQVAALKIADLVHYDAECYFGTTKFDYLD